MATATGLDLQVGYVAETTYGTGVTVTRFLPAISESIKEDIDMVESAGIYAGAQVLRSVQWAQGNKTVSGDIQHELYTQSSGLLFRLALGTVVTATAGGTSVHTFTPVAPYLSASVQVGVPTVYGSVIPKTMTGAMIASWEVAGAAGANLTWGATWVGQELTLGTTLASASYSTTMRPWSFKETSLTIDGTVIPVKSFKIGGDNGLADSRRFLGGTTISQPLREKLAEYKGEFEAEWGNATSGSGTLLGTLGYTRFTGGTESALVITMVSGTLSGTITANVRYNGETPQVGGPGIVAHKVPFKCIASGTLDSNAITVVIHNNDATA